MKKALVIFGGVSSEHDVSVVSAKSVIENIPRDRYSVQMLGISKDGHWYLYTGDTANLPEDKWLEDSENLTPAVISPDASHHGIILMGAQTSVERVDVVFPVLHGKNGEDGTVQGLLELAGIPYVGCGALSSAVCMDKAMTNTVADYSGIAQAKWLSFDLYQYRKTPDALLEKSVSTLGFPIFIKPANAGSSVGISKAKTVEELAAALEMAFEHDKKVVLEEGIDGIEVECAVLGNDEPVASVVGEIVPCNEFYDFDAKYLANESELHIPARLSEEKLAEIQRAACNAYKALGCAGLARVDFFVRKSDGAILLNEPNTIPGFTPISMYPKLFDASGLPYSELLDRLLTLAVER